MHKFLFYNKFIICLYMFRALLCSSSGGQTCIIQHVEAYNKLIIQQEFVHKVD